MKERFQSCYAFITNFIISLSVKLTIGGAYESVYNSMRDVLESETKGLEFMSDLEKLDYLKKYYSFDIYNLFLNNVILYDEKGGKILEISSHLLEEVKNQNEYVLSCASLSKKKFMEIATLWLISLAVLVAIRFALSSYFTAISSNYIYQLMVLALFAFVLFSIELLSRRCFSLNLKGWKKK